MSLEITGKLIQTMPEQTGTGKNGTWVKQEFILETITEQYPRKICFSLWGEKAKILKQIQPGTTIQVSFNLESREFNGRWYTDARAWKVTADEQSQQAVSTPPAEAPPAEFTTSDTPLESDDLPF